MSLSPEEQQMLNMLQAKQARGSQKIVHAIQVLDGSTSMDHGKDITISTFNESVDSLRDNQVGKTTATLLTFSDHVRVVYKQASLSAVQRLTNSNYTTSGMTALFDAIAEAINLGKTFEGADSNAQFLLQIFTDGDENKSRSIYKSGPVLKELIESVTNTGRWTITVAGPGGQINNFVDRLGIHRGNTHTYDPSSLVARGHTRSAFVASTANYMANAAVGVTAMNNAYSSVAPVIKTDSTDPDLQIQP
jgi:hypothetical protein